MNLSTFRTADPLPLPIIALHFITLSLVLAKLGLGWFLLFEPTPEVKLVYLTTVVGATLVAGLSWLSLLQSHYGMFAARALGCAGVIVCGGLAFGWTRHGAEDVSFGWGVVCVLTMAGLFLFLSGWLHRSLPWQASRTRGPADSLATALCCFAVMLGTIDAWEPIVHNGISTENYIMLFLTVSVTGVLLLSPYATSMFRDGVPPIRRPLCGSVVTLLVCGSAIAFVDVTPYYDAPHYMAYLGPANSVWHGGIPMFDVFSQYGQGYLVFLAAFLFFGKTFTSAALVHSLLVALYLSVFAVSVRSVSRNTLIFVAMTLLFFCFYSFFRGFPLNMAPSHGPMRYLPFFVMLLVTLSAQKGHASSFLISLLLTGSWVWSLEAGVTCTLISLSHVTIFAGSEPGDWRVRVRRVGRAMAATVGTCTVLLGALVAAFWLLTRTLPRYDLYFSLVVPYLSGSPATDSSDPFAIWAPVKYFFWESGFFAWLTILSAGAAGVGAALAGLTGRITVYDLWTRRILLLLISGLLMSPTLIINTTPTNLVAVSLPFAAAAIGVVSRLAERRRPSEIVLAFLPTALLLSVFLSATFQTPVPYTTLVHAVVRGDPALDRLGRTLSTFCDPIGNSCRPERPSAGHCLKAIETDPMCSPDPDFEEIVLLAKTWKAGNRILLFHTWQSIMQISLNSRHPYPVSWTMVEGWSDTMMEYILRAPVKLASGDVLFVGRDAKLPRADRLILKKILDEWTTEPAQRTEKFSVLRLVEPKSRNETTRR
jgi:hypothetical protein